MNPVSYIVVRGDLYGYYGGEFLRIEGAFQYPSWTREPQKATPMTRTKAYHWAELERGRVLGVLPDGNLVGATFDGGPTISFNLHGTTHDPIALQTPGIRVNELPKAERHVYTSMEAKLPDGTIIRR